MRRLARRTSLNCTLIFRVCTTQLGIEIEMQKRIIELLLFSLVCESSISRLPHTSGALLIDPHWSDVLFRPRLAYGELAERNKEEN